MLLCGFDLKIGIKLIQKEDMISIIKCINSNSNIIEINNRYLWEY